MPPFEWGRLTAYVLTAIGLAVLVFLSLSLIEMLF